MRNIAIIGASYLQLPLIEKAKEMGYTTHVFAWKANDVGEIAADYFYPISITEIDDIAKKCAEIGVLGICSIATDLGNYTVNAVANKLRLPGNSMDCATKSTNKFIMRQAFLAASDPSPKSMMVDSTSDLDDMNFDFPVIVKPTDRSGSRGIFKLESVEGLQDAVDKAISESFEKKALIEEFAEGKEYSVEGITFQGEHHILAVTEKFTTGAPHFIETGHREPANISDEMFVKIENVIKHALDTLEVTNSASHSEIKIDEHGNIRIIEIGSRMGGDCIGSDLVNYSTGIDFVKAVIQVACGEKPDLTPVHKPCPAEIKYIFTEEDLREFKRIQTDESEKILKIVDDQHFDLIGQTTDSSNRAGCYIVKA